MPAPFSAGPAVSPFDEALQMPDPLPFIREAITHVPAVKYGLAVAAIAAFGSLITAWVGYGQAAIIIMSGTFVSMILLFVFANMMLAPVPTIPGVMLIWATILFFCSFFIMTVTAFAVGRPKVWAKVIGAESAQEAPPKIELPLAAGSTSPMSGFASTIVSGAKS
jgi:hypothetical protein